MPRFGRNPKAEDIPATAEQGYPSIDAGIWYSFVAPNGAPAPIIERLNGEFATALSHPAVKAKLDTWR